MGVVDTHSFSAWIFLEILNLLEPLSYANKTLTDKSYWSTLGTVDVPSIAVGTIHWQCVRDVEKLVVYVDDRYMTSLCACEGEKLAVSEDDRYITSVKFGAGVEVVPPPPSLLSMLSTVSGNELEDDELPSTLSLIKMTGCIGYPRLKPVDQSLWRAAGAWIAEGTLILHSLAKVRARLCTEEGSWSISYNLIFRER